MYTIYCWHCGNKIEFKHEFGQSDTTFINCNKCDYTGEIVDSDAEDDMIYPAWDSMPLENFKSVPNENLI